MSQDGASVHHRRGVTDASVLPPDERALLRSWARVAGTAFGVDADAAEGAPPLPPPRAR